MDTVLGVQEGKRIGMIKMGTDYFCEVCKKKFERDEDVWFITFSNRDTLTKTVRVLTYELCKSCADDTRDWLERSVGRDEKR